MDEEALAVRLRSSFDDAVSWARQAFRSEGFTFLSEMPASGFGPAPAGPAQDTHMRRFLFLGYWRQAALLVESTGGVQAVDHPPCNVVVYEEDGSCVVAAMDPEEVLTGWHDINQAKEARAAVERALSKVAAAQSG